MATKPPQKAPVKAAMSMAVLDQLLTDTLDPGYRAASRKPPRRHWYDGPLVWIGCAAVGLLLVMAYDQSHRSAPARAQARQELIDRIKTVGTTRQQLDDLAKQLGRDVAALRDAQLASQSGQLDELEIAAGSVEVHGPGMVVRLDEPPKVDPSGANAGPVPTVEARAPVLHDRDVRQVVNALWSAGAEAVAINGIRLTSTSAIRFAGESVLVDFQPINAPYTIEAIGPRDSMQVAFADSPIAAELKTKQDVQGIAFSFSGKNDLTLASANVTKPRYAHPGVSATPSQSSKPKQSSNPSSSISSNPSESPR